MVSCDVDIVQWSVVKLSYSDVMYCLIVHVEKSLVRVRKLRRNNRLIAVNTNILKFMEGDS